MVRHKSGTYFSRLFHIKREGNIQKTGSGKNSDDEFFKDLEGQGPVRADEAQGCTCVGLSHDYVCCKNLDKH